MPAQPSGLAIPLVIGAAVCGAILGDNLGYVAGREGGFRLLRRYGRYIHLNERKLKLGVYLFDKHGPKVVFLGRFVAVLRAWAAFLAGSNHMRWRTFLIYNVAGGVLWATAYGMGGYFLGNRAEALSGVIGKVTGGLALLVIVAGLFLLWRNERRLEEVAERALPGPMESALLARRSRSAARDDD